MASDYKIVRHGRNEWTVMSKSGLFYPDEIIVEVKDHGLLMGEWTLNQIVEGFKKSLNPKEEKKYTPSLCGSISEKIDCTWKAMSEIDSRMNGHSYYSQFGFNWESAMQLIVPS